MSSELVLDWNTVTIGELVLLEDISGRSVISWLENDAQITSARDMLALLVVTGRMTLDEARAVPLSAVSFAQPVSETISEPED